MSSTIETYRIAAKEHLARAQDQFNNGSYYLAHYLSGLAVECHLRAWLRRKTKEFESRHDLQRLASESGFYDILPMGQLDNFSAAFSALNSRWRSNHRYYSERQLLDYLNRFAAEFNTERDHRHRGQRWKNAARTLLNYAYLVIRQGEAQWDRK